MGIISDKNLFLKQKEISEIKQTKNIPLGKKALKNTKSNESINHIDLRKGIKYSYILKKNIFIFIWK